MTTAWLVSGRASSETSYGEESWLFVTDGTTLLPDLERPFQPSDPGEYTRTWKHIETVQWIEMDRVPFFDPAKVINLVPSAARHG